MLWAGEAADGFSIFSQSSVGALGEIGSDGDGLKFPGGAWELEDSGSGEISDGEGGNIFLIRFQHRFLEFVQRRRFNEIKLTVTNAHKP